MKYREFGKYLDVIAYIFVNEKQLGYSVVRIGMYIYRAGNL